MIEDSSGLPSSYLWDVSASWTSAGIGVLDTGGELAICVLEVGEPPTESPPETPPSIAQPSRLAELMARDTVFVRLVEQGLADLAVGRYRPIAEAE